MGSGPSLAPYRQHAINWNNCYLVDCWLFALPSLNELIFYWWLSKSPLWKYMTRFTSEVLLHCYCFSISEKKPWRILINSSRESIKSSYYGKLDKIVLDSVYILWVILWFCLGFTPKWASVYSIVAMCTTRPAELLSVYQAIIDTHNRQAAYSVT